MNIRSGAQNRTGPSMDSVPSGEQPEVRRPFSQPSLSSTQEDSSAKHTQFFSAGSAPTQDRHPSMAPHPREEPFSAYPFPEPPFPGPAWTGMDQGKPGEAWLNDPYLAAHGYPPEPYPGYFHAKGLADPAAFPDGRIPGSGALSENSAVSPIHAILIGLILVAGLAIGIWRWLWIDEKLDLATAKQPVAATLPSTQDIDESSSIQSSIDSVYIPPVLNPDRMAEYEQAPVPQAAPPAQLEENPEPSATAPAIASSSDQKKNGSAEAPQEPLRAAVDSRKADSEGTSSDKSNVREAKKRPPRTQRPAQKLASTAKKERMREIDRVRTQAYSETSKDRVGERRSGSAGSSVGPQSRKRSSYRTSRVAQNTVTSAEYARCLRIDHIIRREQCKWSLCNNKWGKGACPSY